jgi:hypothetical protein
MPLRVERLEERDTPATWGNPWPDAAHLTLSFAPDGTLSGANVSSLFSTLNAEAPTSVWQLAVLRAFQTWAVNGNINLSLTTDGGQPFGTSGAIQGDPRFGDIRVGAFPFAPQNQGMEDMAVTAPFAISAGTLAGDVNINSGVPFSFGSGPGTDFFTVLLHEAGHTFGLPDGSDPSSVMYKSYQGPHTSLSAGDIAALQALYGARSPDSLEGKSGNNSFSTASPLQTNLLSGTVAVQADGDVSTLQDQDYFRFTTLLDTGSVAVQLQTAGISLLNARVKVYDAAHNLVASTAATNPLNGDLQILLNHARPLSTYFVKVESGTADVFGIGSFHLTVNYFPSLTVPTGALLGATQNTVTTLLNYDPLHLDGSFLTAALLPQVGATTDARFDYVRKASLSDGSDVDFFRVQAPVAPAGQTNVLTAMVWGLTPLSANGLDPRVTVYDATQAVVPAQVLVNDNGTYALQIANAVSGATYYVKVSAAQAQGSNTSGNYFLGVDFGLTAVALDTYAGGTLTQAAPQTTYNVTMYDDQVVHFVLSATAAGAPAGAALQMTILDANGNTVFTAAVQAGDTISRNVFLAQGNYTVRFAAATKSGTALPNLSFDLQGLGITDPMGPQTYNTTYSSSSSNSSSPPPSKWSGGTNSGTTTQDSYSSSYSAA